MLDHPAYDLFALVDALAVDRWRSRVRRVAVEVGPDAVISRATAARWQGIAGAPAIAPIDVTLPVKRRDPQLPGVDVKRADLPPSDTDVVDDLLVTTPLRTVLDYGRFGERVAAVCLLESAARQHMITIEEVSARADCMPRAPGIRQLREVISLVDLRSESPLETAVRIALLDAGLPYPELQLPFSCGAVTGRIDLAYPVELLGASRGRYVGLAIEADGRDHDRNAETFHHDRVRQTALEEHDWLVRRFTDRSARLSPEYVVERTKWAMARVAGS